VPGGARTRTHRHLLARRTPLALLALLALATPALPAPEHPQRAAALLAGEISRQLGLPSRWRPPVVIRPGIGGALITWAGRVEIDERVLGDDDEPVDHRYGTDTLLAHELVHAVSVGASPHH